MYYAAINIYAFLLLVRIFPPNIRLVFFIKPCGLDNVDFNFVQILVAAFIRVDSIIKNKRTVSGDVILSRLLACELGR